MHNQLTPEIDTAADAFISAIHAGKISRGQIHHDLYKTTADKLVQAVLTSFKTDKPYESTQWGMLDFMHTNIFAFSAAKNLNEFEAFSRFLTDDDGNVRSFSDFKKQIEKLNLRYNKQYLKAEYESAIAQSQNAERWNEIVENREAGEQVEYRDAGDDKVRHSHRALNGMVFNIDDPILDTIAPQNDWGCRCMLMQVNNPNVTPAADAVKATREANIPAYFKGNAGKTGMAYNDGHPYFENAKKELQQLDAVKHYGMRRYEQIYRDTDKLPVLKTTENVNQFKAWFLGKASGSDNNSFAIAAKKLNNLPVTLDNDLYERFLSGKYVKEARWEYATNIDTIIAEPDEVWTAYKSKRSGEKELLTGYIKYFAESPVIVVTRTVNKKGFTNIRMTSLYKLDEKSLANWRKGILRHKKN